MVWLFRILLIVVPGYALAQDQRPAEPPPADFAGPQYIDSTGCVFLRDDDGVWLPRLARDGNQICGYPPTMSARGADGGPRLRALDPNAGRSAEDLLQETVAKAVLTNLRPGELVTDPTPLEKLADMGPEPAPNGPLDNLRAAVAAAPAVRQGMSGAMQPNRQLCKLLGYNGGPPNPTIGTDPSQGFCDALPDNDLARLSFARPIGSPMATVADKPVIKAVAAKPAAKAAAQVAASAKPNSPAKANPPAKVSVRAKTNVPTPTAKAQPAGAAPSAQPQTGPAMIPAGARFVQLGTFGNSGNADRAAKAISSLGYPVVRGRDQVRGKPVQIIIAGPFADREGIVRALNNIRGAGYRDAFPR